MKLLRLMRWLAWGAVAVVGFALLATTGGWLVTDGPLAPERVATGPSSEPRRVCRRLQPLRGWSDDGKEDGGELLA